MDPHADPLHPRAAATLARLSLVVNAPTALREFLTFRLGPEDYGLDVQRVQEIRAYEAPTPVAATPDYIKGVLDLRGVTIPVVDMRVKLRLKTAAPDSQSVLIVLRVGPRGVGMLVDAVGGVIRLTPAQLQPVPEPRRAGASDVFLAIGECEHRMVLLVDIERLLQGAEMGEFAPNAP